MLSLTADNAFAVFADGTLIGRNNDWTKVNTYSVPDYTQVVSIYATNFVSIA